jgi:monothiol glutaredoxin
MLLVTGRLEESLDYITHPAYGRIYEGFKKMDAQEKIKAQLAENDVMLYMKGSAMFPQCGFSGKAVEILKACDAKFDTVDVLSNPDIRDGIKQFSNWPTIPQLYIKGEFIGGSDIMLEMYQKGELQEMIKAL